MKNNVSFNSTLTKFGMGLFETIKVTDYPLDLDLHMNRLFNSIKELNLSIENDKEFYKETILKYIKENNVKNKALRLTVFDEGYNISLRDITYNEDTYKKGSSPILNGIMKSNVKSICKNLDINLVECDINISCIDEYDAVFVTNSLMGIMPVTNICDVNYDKNYDLIKKLQKNL